MLTCAETIAPPRICADEIGIFYAERIDKSDVQKRSEHGAFLVGKTGVSAIRPRILEIDLLMRDVKIAAVDDRTFIRKITQIHTDRVLKVCTEIETSESFLRIWGVGSHKGKSGIEQRDRSAFRVETIVADPEADAFRLFLRKYGRSGITLLLCAEIPGMVSGGRVVQLLRQRFDLLQRNDVR